MGEEFAAMIYRMSDRNVVIDEITKSYKGNNKHMNKHQTIMQSILFILLLNSL